MSFTEQFMTEVLDKWVSKTQDSMAAATADDPNPSMRQPAWADLDKFQQQQLKQAMLPMMLDVLNATVEVRSNVHIATCFPVRDEMIPMSFLTMPVSDDTKSEWHWIQTADGDTMLGFFPAGETYEAMQTVVHDDYDTALAADTLHEHKIPLEDLL